MSLNDDNFSSFIAEKVAIAKQSINELADEILQEMEMNHQAFMWKMDEVDRQAELEHCISPYSTFEDWWNHLPVEDSISWMDDYNNYQWGPNGGEEFSGDFTMAVFDFLRSRHHRARLCCFCDTRHAEPGSCMVTSH